MPKKLSWDLENENSDSSLHLHTGLTYFQVLQIGSRSIINQLIKPANAKKSAFSFFKSQDVFQTINTVGRKGFDNKSMFCHRINKNLF